MKRFECREIVEAVQHSLDGGQALHVHRIIVNRSKAPRCFVAAIDRGEDIAHLFDQDAGRLARTVKSLGVRVVVVERRGTEDQHVDLCGKPLRAAKAIADSLFSAEV